MTSWMPERIVRIRETTLDEYSGEWTEVLRQMMLDFGCPDKIPVKVFSYHDGSILAKYRVAIQIPPKLGLSAIMPYGEARNSVVAYQIAVVEAVTSIREVKGKELLGSVFTSVPYGEIGERVEMDHLSFMKVDPDNAARYLDRCVALLNSLFDTHRT